MKIRRVALAVLLLAVACGGKSKPVGDVEEVAAAAGSTSGAPGSGASSTGGSYAAGAGGGPSGGGAGAIAGMSGGGDVSGVSGTAGGSQTGGNSGSAGDATAPPCCSSESQCENGTCVNAQCEATLTGQCWRDDECDADEACAGAFACACNADCPHPNEPGRCVPKNANCCLKDADCPSDYCIEGECEPIPARGQCWTDRDCDAQSSCSGGMLCRCGVRCMWEPTPGTCS